MSNDFFEKTLEEIIITNPETISRKGFPKLLENNIRQFQLPSGKIIDILSYKAEGECVAFKVFELKRDIIQTDALCQVSSYASELYMLSSPHFKHISIERFVVGTDVSKDVESLINSLISIEVYLYKYTINGILFKQYESFLESNNEEIASILYTPSKDSVKLLERLIDLRETKGYPI